MEPYVGTRLAIVGKILILVKLKGFVGPVLCCVGQFVFRGFIRDKQFLFLVCLVWFRGSGSRPPVVRSTQEACQGHSLSRVCRLA